MRLNIYETVAGVEAFSGAKSQLLTRSNITIDEAIKIVSQDHGNKPPAGNIAGAIPQIVEKLGKPLPKDYVKFVTEASTIRDPAVLANPAVSLLKFYLSNVKTHGWESTWFPIQANGFGDFDFIDVSDGAVYHYWHETEDKPKKLANTFTAYLVSKEFKDSYADYLKKLKPGMESLAPAPYSVAFIAELAHEHVRTFTSLVHGEQTVAWAEAADWQKESAIDGVLYYLKNPKATAEEVHQNWLDRKVEEGWSCGELKDPVAKTHPCMVPYAELTLDHKLKDHLFMCTVNAFIECFNEEQLTELAVAEQSGKDWYGQTDTGVDIDTGVETPLTDLSAGTEGFVKSVKDIWYAVTLSKEANEHRKDTDAKNRGKLMTPEFTGAPENAIRKALKNLIGELEETYGDQRWLRFRQQVEGKVTVPKYLTDSNHALTPSQLADSLIAFDSYIQKFWRGMQAFFTKAERAWLVSDGDLTEALEYIDGQWEKMLTNLGGFDGFAASLKPNDIALVLTENPTTDIKVDPLPIGQYVTQTKALIKGVRELRDTVEGVYWVVHSSYDFYFEAEDAAGGGMEAMMSALGTHADKKLVIPAGKVLIQFIRLELTALSDMLRLLDNSITDVKE